MKRRIAFLLALLFLFGGLDAFASGYLDDMTTIENSISKTYSNLSPQLATGAWATLPDKNFFSMQNAGAGRASVTYRLRNASQVTVSTVSTSGTVVCRNEAGEYVLGSANGGTQTGAPVKYSAGYNSAFIVAEGGTKQLCYDRRKGYVFADTTQMFSDGIPYGVAVWTSSDGSSYQLASQGRIQSSYYPSAQLYYESWTASIPSTATYLKIEINDVTHLEPLSGGESLPKIPTTMTMLARAEIEGAGLIIGVPEPVKTESEITTPPEESQEESSASEESEAKKSSSSKPKTTSTATAAAGGGTGGSGKTTSSKAETASSKFEGEVAAGGGSTQRASTGKKSGGTTVSSSEEVAVSVVEPEEEAPEQKVYYTEKEVPKEDGFSKGLIAYITGVSALILFVLLRPKEKK